MCDHCRILYFCAYFLYGWVGSFEKLSHFAVQANLEFRPRLASNSQQSSCLCLSRIGITDVCHHTQLSIL